MNAPILEVAALAYGFPRHTLGENLTFSVGAGETLCVLGPNGGGKTTLFRTLLALLVPHAGEIKIDGRLLPAIPRIELARLAAYVPQQHAGHFAYTVGEMVLMGRAAHIAPFAAPAARDRIAAEAALAALGISHLAGRVYTETSGGERQLALIARALAQEPKLLVLDEPTANLDFGNQLKVLSVLRGLAKRGIAALFSSHDPDHAFAYADRALLLRTGGMLASGTPEEVITAANLVTLYGIEAEVVEVVTANGRRRVCVPTGG